MAGFKYIYSNNTALTDPTAGKLKFDSTTPGSIASLRISDTDDDGSNLTSLLQANVTGRFFHISKDSDPSVSWLVQISDNRIGHSGWEEFPVTPKSMQRAFSDGDVVRVIAAGTANFALQPVTGPKGRDAGISYKYSTDVANSDPTAGFLKFDNATLASITAMRISDTDDDSNDLSALLNRLDASTNATKALILVFKDGAPQNMIAFQVNAARTDNSGWKSFPITFLASHGAFSNNDVLKLLFVPIGDAGAGGGGGGGSSILPVISMIWDTTTTPPGTPTDGHIGLNNASPGSATVLWASTKDSAHVDFSSYMDAFGSGDGGYVMITHATPAADGGVIVFKITPNSWAFSAPSRQELTIGTKKLGDFFGPNNGDPVLVSFFPPGLT